MTRNGIQHPQVIDLVTQTEDGTYILILVEAEPLDRSHALLLQDKLNNYLGFALDGQLERSYPSAKGQAVRIRIDLYAEPDGFIFEFLRRFRAVSLNDAIDVELTINQRPSVL
jgi:hypothetical protein